MESLLFNEDESNDDWGEADFLYEAFQKVKKEENQPLIQDGDYHLKMIIDGLHKDLAKAQKEISDYKVSSLDLTFQINDLKRTKT